MTVPACKGAVERGLMFIRFISNVPYMLPIEHATSLQITSSCCNICLRTPLSHSQFQFAAPSDCDEFQIGLELDNFISISAFQVCISDTSPGINCFSANTPLPVLRYHRFFHILKFVFSVFSPAITSTCFDSLLAV